MFISEISTQTLGYTWRRTRTCSGATSYSGRNFGSRCRTYRTIRGPRRGRGSRRRSDGSTTTGHRTDRVPSPCTYELSVVSFSSVRAFVWMCICVDSRVRMRYSSGGLWEWASPRIQTGRERRKGRRKLRYIGARLRHSAFTYGAIQWHIGCAYRV